MILFYLSFAYFFMSIFHLLNAWSWIIFNSKRKTKVSKSQSTATLNETESLTFSILIPCYNEDIILKNIINRYLKIDPELVEVIFIDDGSNDGTFQIMEEELDLYQTGTLSTPLNEQDLIFASKRYPQFKVIKNAKNMGKAQSLNRGIRMSSHPLIITLDADSYLDDNALDFIKLRFYDPDVIAVGGTVAILQPESHGKLSVLNRIIIHQQLFDYLKGFYITKVSLNKQNALSIISGAFGVFRKDFVEKVDGFRTSLGEDIDITIKLQLLAKKENKKVIYEPRALCFTQSPKTIKDLTKQRIRWQKGFVDTIQHYFLKLMPKMLIDGLAFHMYFESFILALFSALFRVVTLVFIIYKHSLALGFFYLIFYLLSLFVRALYLVSSVKMSQLLNGQKYNKNIYFYAATLVDIFLFDWYQLIVYLYGTYSYFSSINERKWNKVERYE